MNLRLCLIYVQDKSPIIFYRQATMKEYRNEAEIHFTVLIRDTCPLTTFVLSGDPHIHTATHTHIHTLSEYYLLARDSDKDQAWSPRCLSSGSVITWTVVQDAHRAKDNALSACSSLPWLPRTRFGQIRCYQVYQGDSE